VAFYNSRDYNGAINDFNMSIECNRGEIEKYKALGLFDKEEIESNARELDLIYSKAYYYRGLSEIESGQKEEGCRDLGEARKLKFADADEAIKKFCK